MKKVPGKTVPEANDTVYVLSLKRFGTVLGLTGRGEFEVQVGAFTLRCTAADLQLRDDLKQTPRNPKPDLQPKFERTLPVPKIDLHGLTVEEAVAAVDQALHQAMFSEQDRLEIVHGVGKGKLRVAIHQHLSQIRTIKFQPDPGNAGVTWVYFG